MNTVSPDLSRPSAQHALILESKMSHPRALICTCLGLLLVGGVASAPGRPWQLATDQTQQPVIFEQSGVQYRISPPSGPAPLTVTFEVLGSGNFTWNFGDGTVERGAKVEHTYYRPGEYRVRLEAVMPGRRSTGESRIRALNVGAEQARMIALPNTGTSYTFDARKSLVYAPLERAVWTFGDGTSLEGLLVNKEFKPGLYPVKLEVQGGGKRLTQTLSVRAGPLYGEPSFEDRVLTLTNEARARGWDCVSKSFPVNPVVRLGPLKRNTLLDRAARAQSAAMALADYFDHQSLVDGSKPADRASAAGYAWTLVGENIAAGQPTPEVVVDGWLRSPGHCKNIMESGFSEIGLSFVRRPSEPRDPEGRPFWTQVFGKPK